jgi:hypothetical protein
LLDISEGQLYVHEQSGVTLFRDLLKSVFSLDLASRMPTRILPVSTAAPHDLQILFDSEIDEIRKLLHQVGDAALKPRRGFVRLQFLTRP